MNKDNKETENLHLNGSNRLKVCSNVEDSESDEDDSFQDSEVDFAKVDTLCLFCDKIFSSPCTLFQHMEHDHQFSMKSMACHWSLDQTNYIKYVNFLRKSKLKPLIALSLNPNNWCNEENMKPEMQNDPLLMFDVEEFFDYSEEESESEKVTSLKATCDELKEIIQRQRQALHRLMEEIHGGPGLKAVKSVCDIHAEDDEGYFNSYAYFDIHHEMLSDKVRTEAYREAIIQNAAIFSNKKVLDLGCGTGILSMFAASVGGKVTGVDMSEVIFHAMQIIKENGFDKAIDLRKGRLEDMNFTEKFDVIVSEWMGYFLLFEGMLDSVIYARDNYLSPSGYLLPNRCSLLIVGAEDIEAYEKYVTFWDDVFGFKMNCMIKESIKEASTEIIKSEKILTTPCQIRDFDLMKVTPQDLEFSESFELTCDRAASLTCFVGYFDTFFHLPHQVQFSTGPKSSPTHWKQTIFYLPNKRPVVKGEVIRGEITVKRKLKEIRSLDVSIKFEDKKYHYYVE